MEKRKPKRAEIKRKDNRISGDIKNIVIGCLTKGKHLRDKPGYYYWVCEKKVIKIT